MAAGDPSMGRTVLEFRSGLTRSAPADMACAMSSQAAPSRITVVIPTLTAGGAARLVAVLTRAWIERGATVEILVFDDSGKAPFFPLHPAAIYRTLDLASTSGGSRWRGLWNNLRRLRILRRVIGASRPDVVLSLIDQTNVMTVLALIGTGLKVAVWENTDPRSAHGNENFANWGRRLAHFVYPFAAAVVAQTDEAAAFLARRFGRKVVGIPNPVLPPPAGVAPLKLARPAVIGLGRLSPEKGYDLLLRVFARIAVRFPNWRLYIFGEGPERPKLEALIAALGLVGRAELAGVIADPTPALRAGDLFVLSSHIEGFSLALCEAMACGLPAVSTDCGGPRSVLRENYDGLLVPAGDEEALAAAMTRLMGDDALRAAFAMRAPEVLTRFSLDIVLAQWDALFARIRGAQR